MNPTAAHGVLPLHNLRRGGAGGRLRNAMSSFSVCGSNGAGVLFTLIELLVVIAVIGIMAGLLLPVLGTARGRALSVSCTGNLKQLAVAGLNYSADWQLTPPVSKSGVRWVDLLAPYLAGKSEHSSNNVWLCPADRRPDDKKVVYGVSDINKLSYGINQCYPSNRESSTPILWNGIRPALIHNPAEFIFAADAGSYYIGTTVAEPFFGTLNGETYVDGGYCKYLSFRHDETSRNFNAAFADGHSGAMRFAATPDRYWDYRNVGYGYN